MARISSEEEKKKWQKAIEEQQASGLSKAEWCRQQNLSVDMLYYWAKRLILKSELDLTFTELPNTTPSPLWLEYKKIRIQISDTNYDAKLLKTLLNDLEALC